MGESTGRQDALAGLRVVDASSGTAGPVAAMLMADFGADVVKVEPPGGDPSRRLPGAAVWNRGKRSAAVDASDPASVAAFEDLVRTADVLVTNGPQPGPAGDAAAGPRLVHLVVPAYLPDASWPRTLESEGLLAASTGVSLRQGSASGGPVDAVFPILPVVHGIWAAAAASAALVERERSGSGQTVTVAGLHAVMVASPAGLHVNPAAAARSPGGGPGGSVPFYRTYRCGDGEWLFLAALTPRFTDLAFRVLGVTDLHEDPRLGGRGRAAMLHPDNAPWVRRRIADAFLAASRSEWLARLHAAGCPAGPVLGREGWLDHPQLAAIGMRVEVDDPERGPVVMPGVPLTLHGTPGSVRGAAPPASPAPPSAWPRPPWEAGAGPAGPAHAPPGRGPLAGVTVLDLGAIIAGPFAASLLGELGATVVKVEPPAGDSFRGPGFAAYNKGQRGVAVDLREPRGRDALLALARRADVVVDNYRPGVLDRLGLRWEDLRAANPEIVTVSITGFGEGGPLGDEPGFDPVLQAMSGMMSAQGGAGEPVFFTVPVNDVAAAATAALGALLALLHRRRSGRGQKVTTSLAAMSALLQAGDLVRYDGRPAPRVGGPDHRGDGVLDRYYRASDGWIRLLGPGASGAREGLARLGVTDLDGEAQLAAWVAGRTRAGAVSELGAAGVPAVAARTAPELVDDDAILRAGVLRPDPRPGYEERWTTGTYAHLSRTPLAGSGPAPALGEHTRTLLVAAGLTNAEIDVLAREGVVVAP